MGWLAPIGGSSNGSYRHRSNSASSLPFPCQQHQHATFHRSEAPLHNDGEGSERVTIQMGHAVAASSQICWICCMRSGEELQQLQNDAGELITWKQVRSVRRRANGKGRIAYLASGLPYINLGGVSIQLSTHDPRQLSRRARQDWDLYVSG